jgi:hypothetical protein
MWAVLGWKGSKLSAERHLVAILILLHLQFTRCGDRNRLLGLVAGSLGDVLCRDELAAEAMITTMYSPISVTMSIPSITLPNTT